MSKDPTGPRTPADVITFSGQSFARAVQVGSAASVSRAPVKTSTKLGGAPRADHPMNRFAVAVQEHFGDDRSKFTSFWLRWTALAKILNHPSAAPYTQSPAGTGAQSIHASVFDTAATMPLNEMWEFEPDSFYAEVAKRFKVTSVFG
jgi:hypothetical protein